MLERNHIFFAFPKHVILILPTTTYDLHSQKTPFYIFIAFKTSSQNKNLFASLVHDPYLTIRFLNKYTFCATFLELCSYKLQFPCIIKPIHFMKITMQQFSFIYQSHITIQLLFT